VGLRRAVRPCRIDHVGKPSSVFVPNRCLGFLPSTAVKKSRSQRVEELGSQPSTPSFGSQPGETVGHSWTSRLVNFPAPEPGERAGRHDCEETQNITNEASMLLKTNDRSRHQPPLIPRCSRRGTPGSPPRMRRGGGGVPWREAMFGIQNVRTNRECY